MRIARGSGIVPTSRFWSTPVNARLARFAVNVRVLLSLMLSVNLVAVPGAQAQAPASPLKVAFVYVGPVGEAGWTYAHEQGRLALEKEFGARVRTTMVESVPEGADAERVIRQLAQAGNKVIFTTSFGYMNPTLKVAQQFPAVVFEHATGYKRASNVGTYEGRFFEGAYLLGVLAGGLTKTDTLGIVASFPIPEVIRNIDAYTLGARSVNAKVTTKVIWINTWYDPARERQAAETLFAQGADAIAQNTDSPAIVQFAQEKGIAAFGWDSDMSKFAPRSHMSASTNNWGVVYIDIVKKVLDGSWKSAEIRWGLKEGLVVMAPLGKAVPTALAKTFEMRRKDIIDGRFTPFQGPIKDQGGTLRVPAGTQLAPEQLMALDWYVEGVTGAIPK
jgi:simple sugar transport system substrate-binding protein